MSQFSAARAEALLSAIEEGTRCYMLSMVKGAYPRRDYYLSMAYVDGTTDSLVRPTRRAVLEEGAERATAKRREAHCVATGL